MVHLPSVQDIRFLFRISPLTPSFLQTATWRGTQPWYRKGRSNECEIFQIQQINSIVGHQLEKTNLRINLQNGTLLHNSNPNRKQDGFEWSENFDSILECKSRLFLFNLKMVCGRGGAQTRTLRQVYHFIRAQLDLVPRIDEKITFVNILDGDESARNADKFSYLMQQYPSHICSRVFCGDMLAFDKWWC